MAGHKMPPVRFFTSLSMFKDGVPHRFRFWSIIVFVLFYQFTGGVYLASISQIQGELAFISEDVTMASYCSLIGLNIIFPVLFRWKFFFYTRQMWFVSSIGSLICAILAMYVNVAWLFWLVCLVAGYVKMMGMFACISTIQLNMTPTRRFGVFLPVIYLFVLGALRLSDITATWVAYYSNWKLMYCIIVLMMLAIDVVVYFMMKPDHRSAPFTPLKGVDWLGHVLWVGVCVSAAFIFNFGEHYDWWDSMEIWIATWITILLLALALWRMFFKGDQAFISPEAFRHSATYKICLMLFGVTIISGIAHYVQPIYINGVLGYDSINAIDLNYPQLAGIVMGAILAFYCIVKLNWSLRQYFFLNFLFFGFYVATMYFLVLPETPKEYLMVPQFLLSVGEVMMETGATYALSQLVAFPIFFMNITIIGFVRCGVGSAAGAALVERVFAVYTAKYDMLSAIRETYGIGVWVAIAMLVIIMASKYRRVPIRLLPKIITVWRGQVKGDKTALQHGR